MVDQSNVTPEVVTAFAAIHSKQLRWAIAKVEGTDIVLVKTGERDSPLTALQAELGADPCYIVYDFEATRDDTSTLIKTCFICYSPDECTSMPKKFELQNFKGSVKAKVSSPQEMQINDKADLTESEFRDKFNL